MSPTIFQKGGFRFFFFSREEPRMHIHVQSERGEAKFWLEPRIELARSHGFTEHDLGTARNLIQEHAHEIQAAWKQHFPG